MRTLRRCSLLSCTLFQIIQGAQCNINAGVRRCLHQIVPDRLCIPACISQCLCIDRGLALRHGNTFIIHDLHFSVIVLRQHHRRLAGAAQSARHRNIDNLLIHLQKLIPKLCHIRHRRHGSGNLSLLAEMLIKLFLRKCPFFIIQFPINIKWHRDDKNVKLLSLSLCDSTVAVRYYRNLTHIASLYYPESIPRRSRFLFSQAISQPALPVTSCPSTMLCV